MIKIMEYLDLTDLKSVSLTCYEMFRISKHLFQQKSRLNYSQCSESNLLRKFEHFRISLPYNKHIEKYIFKKQTRTVKVQSDLDAVNTNQSTVARILSAAKREEIDFQLILRLTKSHIGRQLKLHPSVCHSVNELSLKIEKLEDMKLFIPFSKMCFNVSSLRVDMDHYTCYEELPRIDAFGVVFPMLEKVEILQEFNENIREKIADHLKCRSIDALAPHDEVQQKVVFINNTTSTQSIEDYLDSQFLLECITLRKILIDEKCLENLLCNKNLRILKLEDCEIQSANLICHRYIEIFWRLEEFSFENRKANASTFRFVAFVINSLFKVKVLHISVNTRKIIRNEFVKILPYLKSFSMACSRSIDLEMLSLPKLEILLCNECWMFLTVCDFKTIFKSNYLKTAFISSKFEFMDDIVSMFKDYSPYFKPEILFWFYKIHEDFGSDDVCHVKKTFQGVDIQAYFMVVLEDDDDVITIPFCDFDGETRRGSHVIVEHEISAYEDVVTLEEFTCYPCVKGYSLKVDLEYLTDIDVFRQNFLLDKPLSDYVTTLILKVSSSSRLKEFSHLFPCVQDLDLEYAQEVPSIYTKSRARWINLKSLTFKGDFPPGSMKTKHFSNHIETISFDGELFTEDFILTVIRSNQNLTELRINTMVLTRSTVGKKTKGKHNRNLKVLSLHISTKYSFVIQRWFKSTPKLEVLHLLGNGELDVSNMDCLLHHSTLIELRMSINIAHLARRYKALIDRIENMEIVKLFVYPSKDLTASGFDLEILRLEQLTGMNGFENILITPINADKEMTIQFDFLDVRRQFVINFSLLL